MPGANCCITGCGTHRRNQSNGIFKLPKAKDPFTTQWRKNLIDIISHNRVVDDAFKARVEKDRVYICEKHFRPDQVLHYSSRKGLLDGALPSLNLKVIPIILVQKVQNNESVENPVNKKRKLEESTPKVLYGSFNDFLKEVEKFQEADKIWKIEKSENLVVFRKYDDLHTIPQYEVYVDSSLEFTVRVFGWLLSDLHPLYKSTKRFLQNVSVQDFLRRVTSYELCRGIRSDIVAQSLSVRQHAVNKKFKFGNDEELTTDRFNTKNETRYFRNELCELLIPLDSTCTECVKLEKKVVKGIEREKVKSTKPINKKAPLSNTSSGRLISTIQHQRSEISQLKRDIAELQTENDKLKVKINPLSVFPSPVLLPAPAIYFKNVFNSNHQRKLSPFLKLFWEEQLRYLQEHPVSVRYHPEVVDFCFELNSKFPSAYKQIRYDEKAGSGILILPSQRRLKDNAKNKTINDQNVKSTEQSNNSIQNSIPNSIEETEIIPNSSNELRETSNSNIVKDTAVITTSSDELQRNSNTVKDVAVPNGSKELRGTSNSNTVKDTEINLKSSNELRETSNSNTVKDTAVPNGSKELRGTSNSNTVKDSAVSPKL